MHINAWDCYNCTWLPCNVLYMRGHAKQFHETKILQKLSHSLTKKPLPLSLMFFLMHSIAFHFSLDFSPKQSFLSYICFSPDPIQRHLSFTFPTPWTRLKSLRRREAGMWVATLRTFAAMFRPYVCVHVSPSSNFEKPNPSCLNQENMETHAKGETVLIWCW